jgi:hypothetical protein
VGCTSAGLLADLVERPSANGLLPLVPVDAAVLRLAADGDDFDLAVTIEVSSGQVLDRDATFIEQHPLPYCPLAVGAFVNADTAAFLEDVAGLRVRVVANADYEFIRAITIEIGEPDRMAPEEMVVDNMAGPSVPGLTSLDPRLPAGLA